MYSNFNFTGAFFLLVGIIFQLILLLILPKESIYTWSPSILFIISGTIYAIIYSIIDGKRDKQVEKHLLNYDLNKDRLYVEAKERHAKWRNEAKEKKCRKRIEHIKMLKVSKLNKKKEQLRWLKYTIGYRKNNSK